MTTFAIIGLVLCSVILLYAVVLTVVSWLSTRPIRIPQFISPGLMGLPQEIVKFQTSDGLTLVGWWVRCVGKPRGIAILSHGYMMNRCELAPLAELFTSRGIHCLMFDFRAHGRSQGKTTGFGTKEHLDLEAAMTLAVKQAGEPLPFILYGSSMGAAASIFAAAKTEHRVEALILDGAYASLDQAVRGWWEFLGGRKLRVLMAPSAHLGRLFVGESAKNVSVVNSSKKLTGTSALLLCGTHDPLVPTADAEAISAALGSNAQIAWFDACNHAEGRFAHPDQYRIAIETFLDSWISGLTEPERE